MESLTCHITIKKEIQSTPKILPCCPWCVQHFLRNDVQGSACSKGSREKHVQGHLLPWLCMSTMWPIQGKMEEKERAISQANSSEYLLHKPTQAKALRYKERMWKYAEVCIPLRFQLQGPPAKRETSLLDSRPVAATSNDSFMLCLYFLGGAGTEMGKG